MSTQREILLALQKAAENTIHSGTQSLPEPEKIYRKEKDRYNEEVETHDYVSYDPATDTFKIYARSRSIEFQGKDFDWIFGALATIGTEIPCYSVDFIDRGETISSVKVYCGDKLRAGDVPFVTDPETFEGWFYDLEYQLPFDPNDQIFLYTPVYAKRSN